VKNTHTLQAHSTGLNEFLFVSFEHQTIVSMSSGRRWSHHPRKSRKSEEEEEFEKKKNANETYQQLQKLSSYCF
jgi:hypothetical protein